jgi:predicted helicase
MLYAPTHRSKYAECLRIDFPRIPFTTNRGLFIEFANLGARLAGLHLLKSPELDPPTCRFEGQGDAKVAKTKAQGFRYEADEERLYVNRTQYFGPVPREVYEYRIGGYQVCQKWLKDRRERRLELDDIRAYCRIVTAIGHTLTIQHQIDVLYPEADSKPL